MRRLAWVLALLILVPPAVGQHHHHHAMPSASDSLQWRMPPMDMSMPMMPGLETAFPPTGPMLPGPKPYPLARPGEVVSLADKDTLHLEASPVMRTINGQTLVMYGYNGQYPGPMLKVQQGSTIIVRFHNALEEPTTVHWHGLRLNSRFDGIPGISQSPVGGGEAFTYELYFPDDGLYWYHPHVREDVQQDLGLYGNIQVVPKSQTDDNPVHSEQRLILDDVLLDEHGLIPWGEDVPTHALMGRFGNVMLTNGVTDFEMNVQPASVVRFYLTNVANARSFNVTFGDLPIKVIASDISRFERQIIVESVPIAPAERYIVEVRFPAIGTVAITNSIQAIDHFRGEFYPSIDTLGLIHVGGSSAASDYDASFEQLRDHEAVIRDIDAYREYFNRPPDKELELSVRVRDLPLAIMLSMEIDTLYVPPVEWNDAMPMMNWLSTGSQVTWVLREESSGLENMDIQWSFRQGEIIKVRLFNNPRSFHPMHHPIHFHGQRFLVLEIDGIRNTNLVWKDTATVPVGSTVDFLIDMSNPGSWMAHCHIAEHLQSGMMLGFTVEPQNQPR